MGEKVIKWVIIGIIIACCICLAVVYVISGRFQAIILEKGLTIKKLEVQHEILEQTRQIYNIENCITCIVK